MPRNSVMECACTSTPWKRRANMRRGFLIAAINLFTKQNTTIFGSPFTRGFFAVFTISERINHRKADRSKAALDPFNLSYKEEIAPEIIQARAGNVHVRI